MSYPPHRFIGSELMTHRMLQRLQGRGHDVVVVASDVTRKHTWEGVPVYPGDVPDGDVVVYHADNWKPVDGWGGLKVAVCHNSRVGVRVGVINSQPDLAVVNSHAMAGEVPYPRKMIVHPPVTVPKYRKSGDRVALINMEASSKVGPFWDVVAAMPDTKFLAVKGGYGVQAIPRRVPSNVKVLEHVDARRMRQEVWAETRILMVASETESWSMAASEAMAHGIPVIAHPLPGLRENLSTVGVWANRNKPDEWVDAIRFVNSAWDEFSVAVRHRAQVQEATFDREVEAWCDRLEQLWATSQRSSKRPLSATAR